jgi:hypothetical protein
MRLVVGPDGNTQAIAPNDLSLGNCFGPCEVRRASHVEAVKQEEEYFWTVDLSPVGGPILGPFVTRTEALEEETEWLEQRLGHLQFVDKKAESHDTQSS